MIVFFGGVVVGIALYHIWDFYWDTHGEQASDDPRLD